MGRNSREDISGLDPRLQIQFGLIQSKWQRRELSNRHVYRFLLRPKSATI